MDCTSLRETEGDCIGLGRAEGGLYWSGRERTEIVLVLEKQKRGYTGLGGVGGRKVRWGVGEAEGRLYWSERNRRGLYWSWRNRRGIVLVWRRKGGGEAGGRLYGLRGTEGRLYWSGRTEE